MAAAKKAKDERIVFDYTNMLAGSVGAKSGITEKQLEKIAPRAVKAFAAVAGQRKAGKLPFMDLPYQDYAAGILKYAKDAAPGFENFVVLGIGGSALGAIALQTALNPPFYNLMPAKARGGPRFFVEDNVDPERIANMLEVVDPKKTLFNVVSKSGDTAETMSALMIVCGLIAKKVGAKSLKKHIVATTDAAKGNMRKIADREGLTCFLVPDGVGGRFSVLSPVGLLPAAMVGIDIKELLAGAAAMDRRCASGAPAKNPALMGAVLHYLAATEKGKSIQVMMPYSNALRDIADWFRQLWAESLGKKYSLAGKIVHAGQTPVKALGATDQHSQIQLYNEGPADKTITFIRVENFRTEVKIPSVYKDIPGLSYLIGRGMTELLNAEQAATEIAVTKHGAPNCTIRVPSVNAFTVGQLIYMLEVQTAYAGELYGINTFDQPGVEAGKIAAYALMGRPGYEERRKEIEKASLSVKRRKV